MWTVKEIEDYCKATCEEYFNIEFDCTVIINPRLTSTLGRVSSRLVNGSKYVPYKMEFSKTYIECATYETVMDTIKHELCHYVAVAKCGKNHGHDMYFKSLCRTIGCINDSVRAKNIKLDSPMPRKLPKYVVECEYCGAKHYYYRKCDAVTHPYLYICGKCGNDSLKTKIINNN